MSDEIKELLEYFKKDNSLVPFKTLYKDDAKILLNYITNLQKEKEELQRKYLTLNENNQNMQEEMVRTWKKCDDYKQKNEKAVEYIKQHCDRPGKLLLPKIDFNYNELLNILEGSDE